MSPVELDIATSFLIRWWNETKEPVVFAKIKQLAERIQSMRPKDDAIPLLQSWVDSNEVK